MLRRSFVLGLATMSTGCGLLANAFSEDIPTKPDPSTGERGKDEEKAIDEPGQHWLKTEHDDRQRESLLYIPEQDQGKPRPLVLAIHGSGGDASTFFEKHHFQDVCDKQGWIGLFPRTGKEAVNLDEPDDWTYIHKTLGRVLKTENIDKSRVFVVGFSGGCKKVYQIAARSSKHLTAVVVSGGRIGHKQFEEEWSPVNNNSSKLSLLHIHGGKDPKVPLEGGLDEKHDWMGVGMMEGLEIWAKPNGCSKIQPKLLKGMPDRVKVVGSWVTEDGIRVIGAVDPNMGHKWGGWETAVAVHFLKSAPPRV